MRAEQMTAAPPQRQAFTKDSLGMARAVRDLAAMLAVTIVLVLVLSGIAVAEPGYSFDTTPGKLPKAAIPLHYAIELTPDLTSLRLAGVEIVDVELREPTARLVLNAVEMTIAPAGLAHLAPHDPRWGPFLKGVEMTIAPAGIDDDAQRADIALDAAAETATLTFPKVL